MSHAKILMLLGSSSDLPVTEEATALLKRFEQAYSLRICSAHRSPEVLHSIVSAFEKQGGQIYICVAGMSAHLAGVVASLTIKPVLAVPCYRPETAGFDALLSMGQMPKGIPVSTMSFGKHGCINAVMTALQIFALSDPGIAERLAAERVQTARQVASDDAKNRQDFHV